MSFVFLYITCYSIHVSNCHSYSYSLCPVSVPETTGDSGKKIRKGKKSDEERKKRKKEKKKKKEKDKEEKMEHSSSFGGL